MGMGQYVYAREGHGTGDAGVSLANLEGDEYVLLEFENGDDNAHLSAEHARRLGVDLINHADALDEMARREGEEARARRCPYEGGSVCMLDPRGHWHYNSRPGRPVEIVRRGSEREAQIEALGVRHG